MTDLLAHALAADRLARAAAVGDALASEVARALRRLHDYASSREHAWGAEWTDANGHSWSERAARLESLVRRARGAGAIRAALCVVVRELEPLTGAALEETCCC
jgi:hypothetical protein